MNTDDLFLSKRLIDDCNNPSLTATQFIGIKRTYLLQHNEGEIEKLQRQHRFLGHAINGKLLQYPLQSGAKVLDSGCADGTWLEDLNSRHGNRLRLYGVDLSAHLFPRNRGDADLRAHDIRTPFPLEWNWSNAFDCVHQRFLIWGLASAEWPAVVHNLVELVKAGGYVQLVEGQWILPDVSDRRPEQKKLTLVQTWSTESFGMDVHIWNKLAALLRAEGCVDIIEESFDLGYARGQSDRRTGTFQRSCGRRLFVIWRVKCPVSEGSKSIPTTISKPRHPV